MAGAIGEPLLRRVVLCTTGLRSEDKKRCSSIVAALGGKYSGDLTRDVTHLVATEWQSPKYRKAVELGLQIVRPAWVYACERAADASADAGAPCAAPPEGQYRPLYFEGFRVTVSGALEREERSILQAEIEGAGGAWLPALTAETHPLAVTQPEGGKYDAACAAGISVVSLRWCWACVEERCRVDLGVHPPQADDEVPPFRSGWRGAWLPAAAPAPAPALVAPTQPMDGAVAGSDPAGAGAPASGGSDTCAATTRGAAAPRGASPPPTVSGSSVDQADLIAVDVDSETVQGQYLDSCLIHPVGFEKAQMKDLVKLIRRGGGTRLAKPDTQVTHIVASVDAPLDGLTHLRAKIVTVSWLVESCKSGRVAATDSHEITQQQARKAPAVAGSAATRRPSPVNLDGGSSLSTMFAGSRSAMTTRPAAPEAIVDETRYSGRSSPREEPQHALASSAAGDRRGSPGSTRSRDKPRNQLSGKRFTLSHALSESEKAKAENMVLKYGGTISQSSADGLGSQSAGDAGRIYAICPHGQSTNTFSLPTFASPGRSASSGSSANVTLQWVEDCCHRSMKPGKHAKPEVSPAFTPLPFKLPLPNADRCMVCVSGYAGLERRRMKVLLALVGATVDERLSKQTTTMLICLKPEGPKYERAVQWKVPIVTLEWLHKSVNDGKLENPATGTNLIKDPSPASDQPAVGKITASEKCNSEHRAEDPAGINCTGPDHVVAPVQFHVKPELDTDAGNDTHSAAQVDAEHDAITTSPLRRGSNREDNIEQPESALQGSLSTGGSERRTIRGSQPLPLQHSASVTAPLPASQGRQKPAKLEKPVEVASPDQTGHIEPEHNRAGDDVKQESSGGKQSDQDADTGKDCGENLDTSGTKHGLPDDSSTNPKKTKTIVCGQDSAAVAQSNDSDSQRDQVHSAAARVEAMQQQDDQTTEASKPIAAAAQQHEERVLDIAASDVPAESPKRDSSRFLKRSLSDSQVTDSGGKENVKNISVEDDVGRPATAPEVRSEPISGMSAGSSSTGTSSSSSTSTQRQKPDLSLLVKDFKRKFQKKVETPRERDALLPPPPPPGTASGSFGNSDNEPRRVTRSEVERDTTDRPGGSGDENGKRRRLNESAHGQMPPGDDAPKRVSRRHGVEAATASEVRNRLTARKDQQQCSVGIMGSATLGGGISDDEDMYAESQMVVYDRSASVGTGASGGVTAPASSSSRSNINTRMLPPPAQQQDSTRSSPAAPTKPSPVARETRRTTRRNSGHGADTDANKASPESVSPASAAARHTKKSSKDASSKVFMISGLSGPEKKSVTQEIKRLGGTVSGKAVWDPRCTHLITDEVKRVEKTLAACASGRWVVSLEYVKASLRAKKFVSEEPYEHAEPNAQGDSGSNVLANGAEQRSSNELRPDTPRRCRILRATVPALKGGLFSGMKALVTLADPRKQKIVVRVLESGGAAQVEVVPCTNASGDKSPTAPSAVQLQAATALFVDSSQLKEMEVHAKATGAKVYTSDSLSGLLCNGTVDETDGLFKAE